MAFADMASFSMDWLGEQQSPIAVMTPSPVTSPGFFESIWSGITSPFKDVLTTTSSTIAASASKGLSDIILQTTGLMSKPQKQGSGVIINYDRGQVGNAPVTPAQQAAGTTSVNVSGAGGGGWLPSVTGNSTVLIVAAVAAGLVLLAVILRK
jgi:hypothetical protein